MTPLHSARHDEALSAAVVENYGQNCSSYPNPGLAAVESALPGEDVGALISQMVSLEREIFSIEIDWEAVGWLAGTNDALSAMQASHPELTPAAIEALDWFFSYSTR